MSQCAMPAAGPVPAELSTTALVGVPLQRACADLLELLATVTDGRRDQGRDHPVAAVLALAAAATVAGMRGYTAIAGWVADVPVPVLADLYRRAGAVTAAPPGKTTIWRVLSGTDPEALDTAIGTWLTVALSAGGGSGEGPDDGGEDRTVLRHLRLDGKTLRGAKDPDGNQRHLLAVLDRTRAHCCGSRPGRGRRR